MIGIVVTGHLNFATGFQSALSAIAGDERQMAYVDFLESYSTADLEEKLREAVDQVDSGYGILFLTDIPGGSPFQKSSVIAAEMDNADVIAGSNLVMAAEACLERDSMTLSALVEHLLEVGAQSIISFKRELASPHVNSSSEEGI